MQGTTFLQFCGINLQPSLFHYLSINVCTCPLESIHKFKALTLKNLPFNIFSNQCSAFSLQNLFINAWFSSLQYFFMIVSQFPSNIFLWMHAILYSNIICLHMRHLLLRYEFMNARHHPSSVCTCLCLSHSPMYLPEVKLIWATKQVAAWFEDSTFAAMNITDLSKICEAHLVNTGQLFAIFGPGSPLCNLRICVHHIPSWDSIKWGEICLLIMAFETMQLSFNLTSTQYASG